MRHKRLHSLNTCSLDTCALPHKVALMEESSLLLLHGGGQNDSELLAHMPLVLDGVTLYLAL